MGKKDTIKSAVSIFVIIVLAVLIVNMNKLISPKVASEEQITPVSAGTVRDYGDCFSEDPSTVVFVYSNSCPYCNSMKPIIEELEGEGYRFYWAEGSDSEAREVISSCFSDLVGGYVPQFICPATGKEQTGAMSEGDLRKFVDNCG